MAQPGPALCRCAARGHEARRCSTRVPSTHTHRGSWSALETQRRGPGGGQAQRCLCSQGWLLLRRGVPSCGLIGEGGVVPRDGGAARRAAAAGRNQAVTGWLPPAAGTLLFAVRTCELFIAFFLSLFVVIFALPPSFSPLPLPHDPLSLLSTSTPSRSPHAVLGRKPRPLPVALAANVVQSISGSKRTCLESKQTSG